MITSKQNSLIKEIRSLSDKKFRDKLNLYIVEGKKLVCEAIELALPIYVVIGTEKALDDLSIDGVKVEVVTEEVLETENVIVEEIPMVETIEEEPVKKIEYVPKKNRKKKNSEVD